MKKTRLLLLTLVLVVGLLSSTSCEAASGPYLQLTQAENTTVNRDVIARTADGDLTATVASSDKNVLASGRAEGTIMTIKKGGFIDLALSADTPQRAILAVGKTGIKDVAFTRIDVIAGNEAIAIHSIPIIRGGNSKDTDFGQLALYEGNTKIGPDAYLINGVAAVMFPPNSPWVIPANTTKVLTIKANVNGIATDNTTGAVSGNTPQLGIKTSKIKAVGKESGKTILPEQRASDTLYGDTMILRQSKPILAAASLPSTVLSAGEKTLYRWTVTADAKGQIKTGNTIVEVSGSIRIGNEQFVIGIGKKTNEPLSDGIYMYSSNGTLKKLIPSESLRVYDVQTGEQLISRTHIWNFLTDKPLISFGSEQIIPAGQTKTYELKGDVFYGKGVITTKIPKGSVIPDNKYVDSVSFTWNDGVATATDYLVPGIPTAALSLKNDSAPPPEPPKPSVTVTATLDGKEWKGPVIFDLSLRSDFDGLQATGQFQVPQTLPTPFVDGTNVYLRYRTKDGFQSGPKDAYLYGMIATSQNKTGESNGPWIGPYATPVTFTFVFKTAPTPPPPPPPPGPSTPTKEELQKQINDLLALVSNLQAQIDALLAQLAALQQQISSK